MISMSENLRLRTEPCTVCNKTFALSVPTSDLKPDLTGLDIFIDTHGIDADPSHVRILYIDAEGFVRSINTVTKYTTLLREE